MENNYQECIEICKGGYVKLFQKEIPYIANRQLSNSNTGMKYLELDTKLVGVLISGGTEFKRKLDNLVNDSEKELLEQIFSKKEIKTLKRI